MNKIQNHVKEQKVVLIKDDKKQNQQSEKYRKKIMDKIREIKPKNSPPGILLLIPFRPQRPCFGMLVRFTVAFS